MKNLQKLFALALAATTLLASTHAANFTRTAPDLDPRFETDGALFAGCVSSVELRAEFDTAASAAFFSRNFTPENLTIFRVDPVDPESTPDLYDDRFTIDFPGKIPVQTPTKIATILLKNSDARATTLTLDDTSKKISSVGDTTSFTGQIQLDFVEVSECDPDTVPPTVQLQRPDIEQPVPLDAVFARRLADLGKGIDRRSLSVELGERSYRYPNPQLVLSGGTLFFQAHDRLPVDEQLDLKISLADQQKFGGPNITQKTYSFETVSQVELGVGSPQQFLKKLRDVQSRDASPSECQTLDQVQNFLATTPDTGIDTGALTAIANKLNCQPSDSPFDATPSAAEKSTKISLFALTGRTLFFLVFILKIYYLIAYKKTKKSLKKVRAEK